MQFPICEFDKNEIWKERNLANAISNGCHSNLVPQLLLWHVFRPGRLVSTYELWKERNLRLHDVVTRPPATVLKKMGRPCGGSLLELWLTIWFLSVLGRASCFTYIPLASPFSLLVILFFYRNVFTLVCKYFKKWKPLSKKEFDKNKQKMVRLFNFMHSTVTLCVILYPLGTWPIMRRTVPFLCVSLE